MSQAMPQRPSLRWWKRKKPEAPPALLPPRDASDEEQKYRPIEWPLIRRWLHYLWPQRGRYLSGLALGLVMVFLDMQGPRFLQVLINYVTDYTGGLIDPQATERQAIWHVAGVIALWGVVGGIATILQRIVILKMTHAGERVQFELRRRVFAKLQDLSMSYYDKTKLGRIISRCTSDINSLREMSVWGIWRVMAHVFIVGVAALMLLATDWRIFLAVAWLGPVIYFFNLSFSRRIALRWQDVREWFTRISSNLAENITGVRVVTAFNRQSANLSTFNAMQAQNTRNNVGAARLNGVYQPLLELIRFVGRAMILSLGGYLIAAGKVRREQGVGSVVAAFLYWDWLMNSIVELGNFSNQLMMALAGGERVFALLDMKPDVQDLSDATDLPRITGHVSFERVTFGYNPDRPVLHDISFEARPGEVVALVGHTGSGKSSIISLLARFYQPQQGRVLVDGHDIRHATGHSLHRQMGLVLQQNYLFSGTVMNNIRYAKPEATDEQVIAAAQAIGAHEIIAAMADGYQTEVGERGANMSLGQRQLICFARAFLADPRIFMLDEATSAVDTATEMQIQHALERLLEGRTTFIVAHRLSTIMRADLILVLEDGKIIERGRHRELLRHGGKYAALYRQFAGSGADCHLEHAAG